MHACVYTCVYTCVCLCVCDAIMHFTAPTNDDICTGQVNVHVNKLSHCKRSNGFAGWIHGRG